jgi:hypothetical protein
MRPRQPQANGIYTLTPLQVWLGLAMGLLLLVGLTRLLGPDKPVEPPPSVVRYAARPEPEPPPIESLRESEAARRGAPTAEEEEDDVEEGSETEPILIYGTVTAKEDGKPLENAYVIFNRKMTQDELVQWRAGELEHLVAPENTPADAAPTFGSEQAWDILRAQRYTYTDEKGRYAVRVTLAGTYRGLATLPWYTVAMQDLAIEDGQGEVRLDFVMERGGTISGRITERGTGLPAPGIHVLAYPDPPRDWDGYEDVRPPRRFWEALHPGNKSGEDGRYWIPGIMPGRNEVTLFIEDAPYQILGPPPKRYVTVRAGQEVKNVDFEVDPAGRVWGYVWDEERKPVTEAMVFLCNSDSVLSQFIESAIQQRPPLGCRTDANGFYSIVGAPFDREMRVYAYPRDYAAQLSDPFVATPRRREIRVDLFLNGGTTVTGRVLDSFSREPVPKAEVHCLPALAKLVSPFDAPTGFRDTKSDEEGKYTIAHLPPGQHRLYAMAEGYKVSLSGEPIFCEKGGDLYVDLWLTPMDAGQYTVYGTVSDTEGRAIAGAEVQLGGFAEGFSAVERETRTDPRGYYEFVGVDAGMLMMQVEAEGYAPKRVGDIKFDAPTDVVLQASGAVEGRVLVRETGLPPESFRIRAMPGALLDATFEDLDSMSSESFDAGDGRFRLSLSAGTYTLVASAPELTSARKGTTVEAGSVTDVGTLYLRQRGASIRGRVVVRGGGNPGGAEVSLGHEGGSFAGVLPIFDEKRGKAVTVGADGAFEFTHLEAGAYTVTARLAGYADGRSDVVTLGEGQAVAGVEVVLGSGGTLRGSVSIGGKAAPGALVTAVSGGSRKTATADRNGQYLIEALPAGEYLVTAVSVEQVSRGSFAPVHAQARVEVGKTTVCNLGDEKGATIEGFCIPAPPPGKMGFAVLRLAGAGDEIASLNLRDLMSWFGVEGSAGGAIVGFSPVEGSDGYFKIENAPHGQYVLDIFYLNMADVFGRGGQRVATGVIEITGDQTLEVRTDG